MLTHRDEQNIIKMYQNGNSIFDIAIEYDCSTSRIYNVLKKWNVKTRPAKRWTEKEWAENLYVLRVAVLVFIQTQNITEIRHLLYRHFRSSSTVSKYTNLLTQQNFVDYLKKQNRKYPKNLEYIEKFIEPLEPARKELL